METVEYDGWVIEVDRDATRAAFATGRSSAAVCGCQTCQNFIAARERGLVYPSEITALLAKLGIDPTRESEVHSIEPEPGDAPPLSAYRYAGWFNIVGRLIVDGKDYSG